MRPATFDYLAEKQDRYWWNRARNTMAETLLRRYRVAPQGCWLDIGCGPGGTLGIAKAFSPKVSVGLDISAHALELARRKLPHANLTRADLNDGLPFADASFDVVTIFNVLYHDWVVSDGKALCEVARILRHGGILLITEPAFPILTRTWDRAVMGVRRYRRPNLIELCRRAGLTTMFSSYFTSFGFPILLGARALSWIRMRLRSNADPSAADQSVERKPLSDALNGGFYAVALTEAKLIGAGVSLPFGVTLALVATRV